ncbi:hypothetical protein BC828DRAFT_388306 [Blastocladiella britannica]|nr:hypothetical protein BC828DRAFT_388306 [Blastocladiella britannica]
MAVFFHGRGARLHLLFGAIAVDQRASAKVCPLPTNPHNQVVSAVRSAPMTRLHPEPLVPDLSPSAGCCCC